MTKTIEDAAREFAKNRVGDYDYLGNEYEAYLDGSEDAVKWLFSLPLSQRLMDEERENKDELEMAQHFHAKAKASNDVSCRQHYYGLREPYISRCKLLQCIFGKELFGEGEV